ncbi:GPW/gp25 family protein [Pyxidicoccus parkwayensis]|jgi:phage baseplate assembly protein W|uniref:GPW/gp25 family protein n=1 Tax=Pyxidicoccus parkwayensis TaxID=2813578 RepID=A0ABX7P6H1_9BACT|nr:GPW/gp25 family protein [Pyxidicoccus parkwaysis]QSQ26054.1 GPW/gp25 family protein [Pyxidicoccus parkwaysis]
MKRRTEQDVAPFLGRDLQLDYAWSQGFFEDADLATARRGAIKDLGVVEGVDAFTQAVANRLKTRKGELAPLGHPDYGSRHHELLGEPNVERTRNLIKLFVLQALAQEPRIEKVLKADVRAEHEPPRDTVRIELQVRVVGEPTPFNLVVPFSLEPRP